MTATPSASGAMRARRKPLRERRRRRSARGPRRARRRRWCPKLSHGEQRELELAVALATKPQILLLDEPMAGLGVTDSARMVRLLQELRQGSHHRAGRARHGGGVCAGRPHQVLVYGRVIARQAGGDPQNEEVKRAYLGDQHAVTRHG